MLRQEVGKKGMEVQEIRGKMESAERRGEAAERRERQLEEIREQMRADNARVAEENIALKMAHNKLKEELDV